jgi:hypothetical protein
MLQSEDSALTSGVTGCDEVRAQCVGKLGYNLTRCEPNVSRVNIPEIHDQPWLPPSIRDGITDTLQCIFRIGGVYRPIVPRLSNALEATDTVRLVDLCSGSGGPWAWLDAKLARRDCAPLNIQLTDKFPNTAARERGELRPHGGVAYCAESVDATSVPDHLDGFRTMFASFHHFEPHEAAAIIQSAVNRREGIGIFEPPSRRAFSILLTFTFPLLAALVVPFIRPFRWSRLFWTYVVPVIPFVLWFDGVLSCLRAYSPEELSTMVATLHQNDYIWEVGVTPGWLVPVTYVVGYPEPSSAEANA